MVRDTEAELRAGAITLYNQVPLVTTMARLVAREFAFGGATLHTFDSGAAQVPQASVPLQESLLETAALEWCVYGSAKLPLSIRTDGAVVTTDETATEPLVLQTREPRGPGTDGLPLLWTISINAETILDRTSWTAAPEIVNRLINLMGLEPWMVRPAESSAANPDALSYALLNFESQVEQLRRQFTSELLAGCHTLLKEKRDIPADVQVEWAQPLVLKDSAVRHGPTVKVFASCGVPLTAFAATTLNHVRQLLANHSISQDRAAEAERWFS